VFRLVAIALSSLWISGCFIVEEIRKGDALIEQHSVGWREKKKSMQRAEEEGAKAEAETQSQRARNAGPGVKNQLSDWWRETVDEEPVNVNKDDKLVSCKIGGKVQFVRESDCQVRRGSAKKLKSQRKTTVTAPSKPKPDA
jgi:hypothetical protein